jgi:hypothetical protein
MKHLSSIVVFAAIAGIGIAFAQDSPTPTPTPTPGVDYCKSTSDTTMECKLTDGTTWEGPKGTTITLPDNTTIYVQPIK